MSPRATPTTPLAPEQTHEFSAIKSPVGLSTLPDEDLEDPREHFTRSVPDGVKLANLMLMENPGDIAAAQQLTEQVRDRYGFLLADYTTLIRMPAAISSTFAPNSEFLESLVALDDAKISYERRRTDAALAAWRGAAEEAQARLRILEDSAREAGIVELPNLVRGQFLTLVSRVEKAQTLADTTTNTAEKDAAQRAVADLLTSVHGLLNTKAVSDGRIQLVAGPEREPIGIGG